MTATLAPEKYDEVKRGAEGRDGPRARGSTSSTSVSSTISAWDDENDALVIHMTLTSAGCPLTDVLEEQTAQALDEVVERFRINWVWMPPWGPERITDDGRDMMRALGFDSYSRPVSGRVAVEGGVIETAAADTTDRAVKSRCRCCLERSPNEGGVAVDALVPARE